jgi:hypothetical protein
MDTLRYNELYRRYEPYWLLQELREQEDGTRGRRTLRRKVMNNRGKEIITTRTLIGSPDEIDDLEAFLLRLQATRRGRWHWRY